MSDHFVILAAKEPKTVSDFIYGLLILFVVGYFAYRSSSKRSSGPPPLPRQPAAMPPPLPNESSGLWTEPGIAPLVPAYLLLHLASRSPTHQLAKESDGTINPGQAPGIMIFFDADPNRQSQIRQSFVRLLHTQLFNNAAALSALSRDEIVTRLCAIYTEVMQDQTYAIVCQKYCAEKQLL